MTKIPSVEERVEEFYFRYVIQPLVGSEQLDGAAKEAVSFFREALTAERTDLLTQDRDQAYTSLVEGIEGMKLIAKTTAQFMNKCPYNEALDDTIEKVVKPLYDKE